MRLRRSFLVSLFCFICSLLVFINTLAASCFADSYIGSTNILPTTTTLDIFGQSIPCQYWDGQQYVNSSFEFQYFLDGSNVFDVYCYDDSGYIGFNPSYNFLVYKAPITDLSNMHSGSTGADFTIKLSADALKLLSSHYVSVSCGIGFSYGQNNANYGGGSWSYTLDSVSQSVSALPLTNGSQWSGGVGLVTYPTLADYGNQGHYLTLYYKPVVITHNDSDTFSLETGNVTFDYVWTYFDYDNPSNSGIFFYITTPTVSDGTEFDVPSSGGDDDDTGLLTTIKNKIIQIFDTLSDLAGSIATAIINGIKSLFIPDSDDLSDLFYDFWDVIEDTFGVVYNDSEYGNSEVLGDAVSDAVSTPSIRFPGVFFRQYTIIPAQDVPLKPDGFSGLFDTLALVIDIVCTCAFLNMIKGKFEKVVLESDG